MTLWLEKHKVRRRLRVQFVLLVLLVGEAAAPLLARLRLVRGLLLLSSPCVSLQIGSGGGGGGGEGGQANGWRCGAAQTNGLIQAFQCGGLFNCCPVGLTQHLSTAGPSFAWLCRHRSGN